MSWKSVIVKKDNLEKWSNIFFSFSFLSTKNEENDEPKSEDNRSSNNEIEVISKQTEEEEIVGESNSLASDGNQQSESKPSLHRQFTLSEPISFGQWLKSTFTMSDKEIEFKCGNDALQYIRFQRYILIYLTIVLISSIGIILPLNFQGNLLGDETSFEHTTLANLQPNSLYLWAHVVFSFAFFVIAILVMRRFSKEVHFKEVDMDISRTLIIDNVPRVMCYRAETFETYFEEAFLGVQVKDVRFAYDVKKALSIHQDLSKAETSKEYCKKWNKDKQIRRDFHPKSCARFCGCFCCCTPKVNTLRYYSEQEERLREDFIKAKENSLHFPVGIIFVTFKTLNMAKEVHDSFKKGFCRCSSRPPVTDSSSLLKPEQWNVNYAISPDDIHWENLSITHRFLLIKKIVINVLLFFVAFFLTTPEYMVSQTQFFITFIGKEFKIPSWFVDFLPTLLLWSFTALMPLLVSWSDRYLGHWSRSAENHSIMKKTFWYLLFMVVFLPTFGFTTADAIVKFLVKPDQSQNYRWDCVFLPDSGAFFVNYIITASFVGNGLELIRLPELLFYLLQIGWSKSEAEVTFIRNNIKYEFRFGEQYARIMLIFCMTIMYSLSCPLIAPAGLMFFTFKHYVDRHNLLYAYKPSKINKEVHSTAISFVMLSVIVLQFFMLVFFVIRSTSLDAYPLITKIMVGVFLISVNIFSSQLWANTCKKFSPIKYEECTYIRDDIESNQDPNPIFLPDILKTKEDIYFERNNRIWSRSKAQAPLKNYSSIDSN